MASRGDVTVNRGRIFRAKIICLRHSGTFPAEANEIGRNPDDHRFGIHFWAPDWVPSACPLGREGRDYTDWLEPADHGRTTFPQWHGCACEKRLSKS
jgi:hypothetical protein